MIGRGVSSSSRNSVHQALKAVVSHHASSADQQGRATGLRVAIVPHQVIVLLEEIVLVREVQGKAGNNVGQARVRDNNLVRNPSKGRAVPRVELARIKILNQDHPANNARVIVRPSKVEDPNNLVHLSQRDLRKEEHKEN